MNRRCLGADARTMRQPQGHFRAASSEASWARGSVAPDGNMVICNVERDLQSTLPPTNVSLQMTGLKSTRGNTEIDVDRVQMLHDFKLSEVGYLSARLHFNTQATARLVRHRKRFRARSAISSA